MMPNQPKRMTGKEWLILIFLSILWGSSFITAKISTEQYTPIGVVLWRVIPASLVLAVLIFFQGKYFPKSKAEWQALIGMSILNNLIPMTLIFYGLTGLPSNVSAALNATTPLFTVLVLHFFTQDEKATPLKVFGVMIGFFGVLLLLGVKGLSGAPLAILASLAGACSYGFSALWGKRFKALAMPPMTIAFGQLFVSSIVLIIINGLFFRENFAFPTTMPIFISLSVLALLCTALAYILFFKIMTSAGATNIMLVTFLIPISGFIFGWIFMGEVITLNHLLGIATIGIGLAIIDGRLLKKIFP